MRSKISLLVRILRWCVIVVIFSCNQHVDTATTTAPKAFPGQSKPNSTIPMEGRPDPPSAYPQCPMPASLHFKPHEIEKRMAAIKKSIDEMAERKVRFSSCIKDSLMKDVLASIPIRPSDTIADIGSGTGYFEMELLEQGIPFQKLFAVDVNNNSLEMMRYAIDVLGYPHGEKVTAIHSTMRDTMLPVRSVDLTLIIRAPFYLRAGQDGFMCLKSLYTAMKFGGNIHVFDSSDADHGKNLTGKAKNVEKETKNIFIKAGFHYIETKWDIGDTDRIHMIFTKTDEAAGE